MWFYKSCELILVSAIALVCFLGVQANRKQDHNSESVSNDFDPTYNQELVPFSQNEPFLDTGMNSRFIIKNNDS
jgi:hypothetical protein